MQAPLLVTPSREMPAYRVPLALGDAFDNRLWESTHERDWLFFSYLLFNFSKGLIRSPVTPRTLPIETSHIPTLLKKGDLWFDASAPQFRIRQEFAPKADATAFETSAEIFARMPRELHPQFPAACVPLCVAIGLDFDLPGHRPWLREELEPRVIIQHIIGASPTIQRCSFFYLTVRGFRVVYYLEFPILPSDYIKVSRGLALSIYQETQNNKLPWVADIGKLSWPSLFAFPRTPAFFEKLSAASEAFPGRTSENPASYPIILNNVVLSLDDCYKVAIGGGNTSDVDRQLRDGNAIHQRFKERNGDLDIISLANPVIPTWRTDPLRKSPAITSGNSSIPTYAPAQGFNIEEWSIDEVPTWESIAHYVINAEGRPTEWAKACIARLKSKDPQLADLITGKDPPAFEGDRHTMCLRISSWLIYTILPRYPNKPAPILFALAYRAVEAMGQDESDGRSFLKDLWHVLCEDYEKYHTTLQESATQRAELIARIRESQGWYDAEEEFIYRRLIVTQGQSFYVMEPTGYYSRTAVPARTLIARILQLGMEVLMTPTIISPDGRARQAVAQDFIDRYCLSIEEVVLTSEIEDPSRGGVLKKDRLLIIPLYGRDPALTPRYDREVDEWLRLLFVNPHNFFRAIQWLSWAPAVDEGPICAMVLLGEKSIGKGLLTQGLADVFTCKQFGSDNIFSAFNTSLLKPVISLDEGLQVPKDKLSSVSDMIRRILGGGQLEVNQKFRDPVSIRAHPRVLVTSNNERILSDLISSYSIGISDMQALSIRFMTFDVRGHTKAAEYLTQLGGLTFTSRYWAGEKSDKRLARHILWLYHEGSKHFVKGSRYLIEGDMSLDTMRTYVLSSPYGEHVFSTLLNILNKQVVAEGLDAKPQPMFLRKEHVLKGIILDEAYNFWVTTSAIQDSCLDIRLRQIDIEQTLTCIVEPGWPKSLSLHGKRYRWYKVDLAVIAMQAQKIGRPFTLGDIILDSRDARFQPELAARLRNVYSVDAYARERASSASQEATS